MTLKNFFKINIDAAKLKIHPEYIEQLKTDGKITVNEREYPIVVENDHIIVETLYDDEAEAEKEKNTLISVLHTKNHYFNVSRGSHAR